jgi:dihydrofolate reductase
MGRIVVTEFISVDGVVEDPGGSEGYEHGGWALDLGEDGGQFKFEETMESEAMLLGRKTYEHFAQVWPSQEGPYADKFNSAPKYVVSSTLEDPSWDNTTVLGGDLAAEVAKLRRRHQGDVVVHGSAQLVRGLLANDLIDELRLMVFPVLLGSGKRLFDDSGDKKALQLAETRTIGGGVTILVYRKP